MTVSRDQEWTNARGGLRASWVCVARASALARESVLPVTVDHAALLLTRDRDGRLHALHNVCSHRGHPLVESACERRGRITCPYHGWSYGLDGRLRTTPHIGGPGVHRADGFDPARHGLVPVAVDTWWDLVFVNLDGSAPPLAEWVAPLDARWRVLLGEAGLAPYRPAPEATFALEVAGAWPLAVENYCESYHLPCVHPGLNSYSRIEDHYTISEPGRFGGQGTRVYEPRYLEGASLVPNPSWPADRRRVAEYVALFPNLLLGLHEDHAYSVRLDALGPDRTREVCDLFFVEEAAESQAHALARERTRRAWIAVFEEDIPVVEGMHRGRSSPAYDGGAFSPVLEAASVNFYQWLHQGGAPDAPGARPG